MYKDTGFIIMVHFLATFQPANSDIEIIFTCVTSFKAVREQVAC